MIAFFAKAKKKSSNTIKTTMPKIISHFEADGAVFGGVEQSIYESAYGYGPDNIPECGNCVADCDAQISNNVVCNQACAYVSKCQGATLHHEISPAGYFKHSVFFEAGQTARDLEPFSMSARSVGIEVDPGCQVFAFDQTDLKGNVFVIPEEVQSVKLGDELPAEAKNAIRSLHVRCGSSGEVMPAEVKAVKAPGDAEAAAAHDGRAAANRQGGGGERGEGEGHDDAGRRGRRGGARAVGV